VIYVAACVSVLCPSHLLCFQGILYPSPTIHRAVDGSDICCSVCFYSVPFSSSLLPGHTISKSNNSWSYWCRSDICSSVFLFCAFLNFAASRAYYIQVQQFTELLMEVIYVAACVSILCLSQLRCFQAILYPSPTIHRAVDGSDICCIVCFYSVPFSTSLLPGHTISKSNNSQSCWWKWYMLQRVFLFYALLNFTASRAYYIQVQQFTELLMEVIYVAACVSVLCPSQLRCFQAMLYPSPTIHRAVDGSDICCSVCFCSMPFSTSLLPGRTISKSNNSQSCRWKWYTGWFRRNLHYFGKW